MRVAPLLAVALLAACTQSSTAGRPGSDTTQTPSPAVAPVPEGPARVDTIVSALGAEPATNCVMQRAAEIGYVTVNFEVEGDDVEGGRFDLEKGFSPLVPLEGDLPETVQRLLLSVEGVGAGSRIILSGQTRVRESGEPLAVSSEVVSDMRTLAASCVGAR